MNQPDHSDHSDEERMLDLLIQQSTAGLSETEAQELERLIRDSDNSNEPERFDGIAAALDLAGLKRQNEEELPASLRDRVLIDAGKFFSEKTSNDVVAKDSSDTATEKVTPAKLESKISKGITLREGFGWLVAAASIMVLLTGLNPFAMKPDVNTTPTISQRLDLFIESKPDDLVDLEWQPIHTKEASGRVVWSDKVQEGYMIFEGLDVNDPNVEQYQLWIFDTDPAQKVPIDGGVFDIAENEKTADGKYIVPIRAHVPIDKAVQFAVTMEKPGGVYVSKRERIPVLASLTSKE